MKSASPRPRSGDKKRQVLSPKASMQPNEKQPRVLSPTQVLVGCNANALLEESLTALHRSMEQVHSSSDNDENKKEVSEGDSKMNDSSAWLMGIFKDLKTEKRKKDNYKNQLKDALRDRLLWLEGQLHSEGDNQTFDPTLEKRNDPSGTIFHTISSLSTQDSTSLEGSIPPKIISPKQGQEGYEVSFTFQEPRVQQLEDRLALALQQHEQERKQWYKTLEDAAMVTAAGEQLSAKQEKQLGELQEQFAAEQWRQRKQLKEKTKILMELLELTEQQQSHERSEWEEEVKLYELTISRLSSDKAKVEAQVKSAVKELTDTQSKLKAFVQEKQLLKREKEAAAKHLARVSGQKDDWARDKESYEDTVAQLIADKERMRKQIARLQENLKETHTKPPLASKPSPGRVARIEENLDRVTAERDLSRQEAKQLRVKLDKATHAVDKLNHQSREASERFDKERAQWEEKIAAKDKKIQETRDSVENEVVNRMEQVLKERDDSVAVSAKESGDSEWAQKYEASIHKRNELVARIKKTEEQRSKEKGEWKLQLESALAGSRRSLAVAEELETKLEEQRQRHEEERDLLQERLKTQRNEFVTQMSEMKQEKSDEGNLALETELKTAKADTERRIELLREKHDTEKQTFAKQLEALKSENAEIRGELAGKKDQISILQAENEQDREDMKKEASDIELRHEREMQLKKSLLMHSEAEVRQLTDKVKELKERLQEALRLKDQFEAQAEHNAMEMQRGTGEIRALREQVDGIKENTSVNENAAFELCEWKELATKSQDEAHHLSHRVEQHRSQIERLEAQLKQTQLERDRYKYERRASLDSNDRPDDYLGREALSKHKDAICDAIEELRQDVVSIRETINTSRNADDVIANANYEALRNDLGQLQTSLNDVTAELTLETEAMFETRNAVLSLTKTSSQEPYGSSNQGELYSRVDELNARIKKILDSGSSGDAGTDVIRMELVSQLQGKDAALEVYKADMEMIKTQLTAETERREKAEVEVRTLNDQADAYTEELMHLQADNARLSATLKEAERKMVSVLYGKRDDNDIDAILAAASMHSKNTEEDSLPLLDGALALAQSLSDIVQCQDCEGKDTTVMEMLQSLSEKMDQHDRGELPGQSKSDEQSNRSGTDFPSSPLSIEEDERRLDLYNNFVANVGSPQCSDENPPLPVETPLEIKIPTPVEGGAQVTVLSPGGQGLQLMVEQLYGRCQLLERERLEMMETTLDLLESARHASKAELDAALATARSRASEDMARIREKNNKERERLYHKLCRKCVSSLPCDSFSTQSNCSGK